MNISRTLEERMTDAEARLEQLFKMRQADTAVISQVVGGRTGCFCGAAQCQGCDRAERVRSELRYAARVLVTREPGWEQKVAKSVSSALAALGES